MGRSLVAPGLEVHVLEDEWLHVPDRLLPLARVLPRRDVAEALVVAQSLALLGLVLLAEVPAAGFLALEGVEAHQLAELEEVGHAAGHLERLVELSAAA